MGQVKVYTTGFCRSCEKAKAYLKEKGHSFLEVSLDGDPKQFSEMQDRTGARSVPVIEVGERYVIGFSPLELERLLN
jgi:glutaredoxin 3